MTLKSILKTFKKFERQLNILFGVVFVFVLVSFVVNNLQNKISVQNKNDIIKTNQESTSQTLPAEYEVANGDRLWDVALKFYGSGYYWIDIAKANNLSNPDIISAGQKLMLPKIETVKPINKEINRQVDTQGTIQENTYTIVRGDNLWNIALRAYGDGYRWVEIARNNNLDNPNLIHAGNELKLPR